MNNKHFKLAPLSAAVLLAVGSYWALADVAPVLTLGQTITVTAETDGAPEACTVNLDAVTCPNLRSAVEHANGNLNEATAYDVIKLDNGSTHTLSVARDAVAEAIDAANNAVGDLDIDTPMNIETVDASGAPATIQGAGGFGDRLLHVNSIVKLDNLVLTKGQGVFMNGGAIYAGDSGNTTITNSVITDNFASWDQVDGTGEVQGSGGGIYSKGPLSISMSTLSKNTAKTLRGDGVAEGDKIGNGGAIYASQATTIADSTVGGVDAGNVAINGGGIQMAGGNKLEIVRSTFSHNDAVSGGAVNVVSPSAAPFTITNSTISTNHVTDSGAGINTNASVSILNSTIADNVKDSANKGSGLNLVGGTVATLKNTLFVNNLGSGSSANCGKTGTGDLSVISAGGNLSTDATCNLNLASDQQSVADAKIGPLALNDNDFNETFTHALLDGSPAIDKALNDGCPSSDQRGSIRPFDALVIGTKVCDVGAYELFIDRKDLAITSMLAVPDRLEVNSNSTVTVEVENTDDAEATGVAVATTLPGGVTFVSGSAGCAAAGPVVNCAIGTVAAGASAEVEMVVNVTSAGANVIESTVTSASADPFPENNTASVTVVGLTNADLNLTTGNVSFSSGGQGQVTFTVLNQGAGDAKNVVLTGAVPDNMTLAGISDPAVCTVNGAAFSCTIPELLVNASKAVTVTVSSSTAGTYNVTAQVTGDVVDSDAADNAATAVVTVTSSSSGGGCAIGGSGRFDPTLPALAAAGLVFFGLRRFKASK